MPGGKKNLVGSDLRLLLFRRERYAAMQFTGFGLTFSKTLDSPISMWNCMH